MKTIVEALTYDDVLVIPRYSEVLPSETDIRSKFSKNVTLNVPIASSPMDTVTESALAIAMAQEGGIGIIHRRMTIEQQAEEVRKVKRKQSLVIFEPWTLGPDDTVGQARALMREKGISGIPIVDGENRLVGILTRRDLQFRENGDRHHIREVMTTGDLVTGIVGISTASAEALMKSRRVEKLPLVDDHYRLVGLMTAKDLKRHDHPNVNVDINGQLVVGAAVGATGDYYNRALALHEAGADVLVIDTAHGDSKNVKDALRRLKNVVGMTDVVAGNIATADAARMLLDNGADGLRVGIGPGSICTTRIVTGCGVPQVTAILWVADHMRGELPIIADGGIEYSGQITIALAAGASSVMLGNLLARTEEAAGRVIDGGSKYYRGMGSDAVLQEGGDRYGAKAVPEGVESSVPLSGPLARVWPNLVGGLRQGMGYAGCRNLYELQQASFVKMTPAGRTESHVHGVHIATKAPNYSAPR